MDNIIPNNALGIVRGALQKVWKKNEEPAKDLVNVDVGVPPNPEAERLKAASLANRGHTHLRIAAHVEDAKAPLEAEIARLAAALAERSDQLAGVTAESQSARTAELNLRITDTQRDAIDKLMGGLSDPEQADILKILREILRSKQSLGVAVAVATEGGDLREGSVKFKGKSIAESFIGNKQAGRVQEALDKYLLLSGSWSWSGTPDLTKSKLPRLNMKDGVVHIDGRPYLTNTQQRKATFDKLDKRQQFSEGKAGPIALGVLGPIAGLMLSNAMHEMNPPAPVVIHDTAPAIQAPLLAKNQDSGITSLHAYREAHFEKVPVQEGEGYTQLLERFRHEELEQLGIVQGENGSISAKDRRLGVLVEQMKLMTVLDQVGKFDLKHLTDPHFIEGPAGKLAYIPKGGELAQLLKLGKTN